MPSEATSSPHIWIVVPAYNEAARIGRTIQGLVHHFRNVVVVDDGSKDATFDALKGQPVWALRHPINLGQGAALQTGIDFAVAHGAEVVVTFDADGQHDVHDIQRLVEPVVSKRAEVALGSRFLGTQAINMPTSRWLILKMGVLFTRICSRINVTDTHNGLRALSRAAATKLRIRQNRMAHASEILDQIQYLGLKFEEVPVTVHYSDAVLEKGQQNSAAVKVAAQFLLGRMVR
ncbi:glycosyltransferase family 2 protein [Blastopirellula marina]|uniref:Glycosyltransferase family 2 protein n=1 Tax=Blastopirellula marina TaxID=124 RepID=A0A2S8F0M9_9BACT|nr:MULTISPECIES: glycosyltransferase family 2 protein [Pirellulaceae]PQO25728.1 glycosyltransferase family 2 protein [Blastopirellula marina]RCS43411.1 glycosyltransferase family 2 protein [Bremerella cremea]